MEKVYFHVDLDAFFASVEQLDHSEYRNKPVIVGGLPGDVRSVVSTASYEARKFGVHSAMPVQTAYKLCPNGIFVRGNMKRYHEKSDDVMEIFTSYSPDVQQMSIDEAFIDMTGTEKLFGPPIEAALKLKKEVKEKTGLTVSIGIAPTKYLAKIASGLQKPDGLYCIPSGTEEQFMLHLPLEKVWGVGSKTLSRLYNLQIKTTQDIHSRSLSMLQSLLGNATGSFLYHAVRGHDGKDFDSEPKSHSISSENTYSTDLIYQDQIETALLELCHTVFFRMLKEKIRSKTITLKIRYEDFSTVTCQETFSTYISSLDDYFEKIKSLFKKKYEQNRGIRLLGTGLSNTENESDPRQNELFDFGESRRQKVENAILKAEQKNPELKITKARLLKKFCILFFAAAILFSPVKLQAQTVTESNRKSDGAGAIVFDQNKVSPYFNKDSVSLFNYNIDDQNVEFLVSGYWQSSLNFAAALSTGYGTTSAPSLSSPVFTQNVDISMWLFLNKSWYFEAAFADQFEKNTIAIGYTGNGLIKEARLSNRGIKFPAIYSVDNIQRGIGGGDNSAPGFHIKLENTNFYSDTVIRYDMVTTEDKRWLGKNSVVTSDFNLSDWYTGFKFAFPDNSVQYITEIYVESANGTKIINGRKYNKLNDSQFLISGSTNSLYLSTDAKSVRKNNKVPAVIAVTSKKIDVGSWDDPSSFAGKVQKAFGSEINLSEYDYDFITKLDEKDALIIQSPDGFSPFVYANIYDAGISTASDGQIVSTSTDLADTNYFVMIDNNEQTFVSHDFINIHHIYATVYNSSSPSNEEFSAETRFPMASLNPGIYLGYGSQDDSVLRIRTYTAVSRFDIGSKAIPGTVHVYKNGFLDPGAVYNQESGEIRLSQAVSENDNIYATWYEENENSDYGSIAIASGAGFNIYNNLNGDISLSSRINYSPEKNYSTPNNSSPSYVTLASKLAWNDTELKLSNISAVTLDQYDNTKICRILSMDEDRGETVYLSPSSSYNLPAGIIPALTSRNGSSLPFTLLETNDGTLAVSKGHEDSQISGYAQSVEFNFTQEHTELQPNWAAISIALPGTSSTLKNASTFSIAIKPLSAFQIDDADIYLQLGVKADSDELIENSKLPCWKISENGTDVLSSLDITNNTWQTVTVCLNEKDKARITNDTDARIVIVSKNSLSGTILAGPYAAEGINFNVAINDNFSIFSVQEQDSTLKNSTISKLNSNKNYVEKFTWKTRMALSQDEELNFSRYFEETDISHYKKLNLWIKTSSSTEEITISLDRKNKNNITENAVKLIIEKDITNSLDSSSWHKLTVNLDKSTAEISGHKITNVTVNKNIVPSRFNILAATKEDGYLYIDELILNESTSSIILTDKIEGEYNVKNDIFDSFNVKSTTLYNKNFELSSSNVSSQSIKSDAEINLTAYNVNLNTAITSSSAENKLIPQAYHSIQTVSPILNIAKLSESYNYDYTVSSLNKTNKVSFTLTEFSIPLLIETRSSATSDTWGQTQKAESTIAFNSKIILFTGDFSVSQKIQESNNSYSLMSDYFSSWKQMTEFQFSKGKDNAATRSVQMKESVSFKIPLTDIKPRIDFSSIENYKNAVQTEYNDITTTSLSIPLNFAKNSFLFKWTKSAGLTKPGTTGGNYEKDITALKNTYRKIPWYFTSLPFYDLYSSSLKNKCFKTVSDSDIHADYYTGNYSLSWKRSFAGNKYDFFIPTASGINFSRDIRSATNLTDIHQIQAWSSFTAMNVFGRTGTIPLFNFFNQDEYTTSLETTVKIPEEKSNLIMKLSGYTMISLYFTDSDYIKTAIEGFLQTTDDYSLKSTITWKRNATGSPVLSAVKLFASDYDLNTTTITRNDSINFQLTSTDNEKQRIIAWIHNLELQLTKFISLSTEISLSYNEIADKIIYLNATGSAGILIKF